MRQAKKMVQQFVKARGWEKQLPADIAKSISIEAAELLELFQWSSPTVTEVKKDLQTFTNLQHELADVLIYCMQMASVFNLNPDMLIKNKLIIANKKYPAKLMRKHAKGNNLNNKKYLEIRNRYRKNRK